MTPRRFSNSTGEEGRPNSGSLDRLNWEESTAISRLWRKRCAPWVDGRLGQVLFGDMETVRWRTGAGGFSVNGRICKKKSNMRRLTPYPSPSLVRTMKERWLAMRSCRCPGCDGCSRSKFCKSFLRLARLKTGLLGARVYIATLFGLT